jgi:hypothetical protein
MQLCAKCHENQATVHITSVTDGKMERIDLCKSCAAPSLGLPGFDEEDLKAYSVDGKRCEFCGSDAVSGVGRPKGTVYWCMLCGMEFSRIVAEIFTSERPDLLKKLEGADSYFSIMSDPELQAWSEEVNERALKILKERRREDGRDQSN